MLGHPGQVLHLERMLGMFGIRDGFPPDHQQMSLFGEPVGSGRQWGPGFVRFGLIPERDRRHEIVALDESIRLAVRKLLRAFVLDFHS